MSKYLLHGKLKAKAGKADELSDILIASANTGMKGCKVYAISKDPTDKDSVWVTEIWDSKEDHDNSLKQESVKAAIAKAMPILDGMPEKGQQLELMGGWGV